MNNLCPESIRCPGTDFPVTNYSSEGGEPILPYLGVVWPPPPPPPPGSGFWATGCIGDCLSYTSQQEADECAQLQAALCNIGPNDGGGGGGTTPITPYYSGEASCTVNCSNGTAFTYYVNAGLFVALTQAQANAIAQAYACEKAQESLVCLGDLQRCWCLGDNRTSTIVPSGGVVVAWVVVSGSLPPGLVFSGGVVSGIPTTGGTYSITIRGYLANGSYAQRTYVLTALNITQTTLPNGTEGANYDQQLTVTGGTAPYTFTLIGGGFPLGVDITTAGLITGVVGEVGVFNPVIQVTDVTGCICSRVFELTTESALTCPSPQGVTAYTVPLTYQSESGAAETQTGIWVARPAVINTKRYGTSWQPNMFAMDVVDFTTNPALRVATWTVPWAGHHSCWSAIYDPVTQKILAHIHTDSVGITQSAIVIFNTISGYESHVVLPEMISSDFSTVISLFVPMFDKPGKYLFRAGAELFTTYPAYVWIFDSVTSDLTLIWGDGVKKMDDTPFNYDCTNQEIMFKTGGKYQCFDLTGAYKRDFPTIPTNPSSPVYPYYVDSSKQYVTTNRYAPSKWGLIAFDPITGAISAELNLDDLDAYFHPDYTEETFVQPPKSNFLQYITLNRKLNRLCFMVASFGFNASNYQWMVYADPITLEIKNTVLIIDTPFLFNIDPPSNIVDDWDTGAMHYNFEAWCYRLSPASITP